MPQLNTDQIMTITALCEPFLRTENERRTLIDIVFAGVTTKPDIDISGAPGEFTRRLIFRLRDYGDIESGKPALWMQLEVIRQQVGVDKQAQIDALKDAIFSRGELTKESIPNPVDKLKQMIHDSTKQIDLEELLRESIESPYAEFTSTDFYEKRKAILNQRDASKQKVWKDRFQLYFSVCENTLALFATLSYYGTASQVTFAENAVRRWIAMPQGDERHIMWRYFPSIMLIYACGISALYKHNWDYFGAVLLNPTTQDPNSYSNPTIAVLHLLGEGFYLNSHREFFDKETTVGQEMKLPLRSLFSKLIRSDEEFHLLFDLFEMMLGFSYLTIGEDSLGGGWMPPHNAIDHNSSWRYIAGFWEERGQEKNGWGLIGNKFLQTTNKVEERLKLYQDTCALFNRKRRPNYASAYEKGLAR
jgi:Effector-associated domain 8